MSTSLLYELLIIQNKTSKPEDFEFTRLDCNKCYSFTCTAGFSVLFFLCTAEINKSVQ